MLAILIHICLSTQFGHPGDGYGGRTPTVYHGRPVQPGDVGIAHRTWPMGAWVLVRNVRTGKAALARVIDRGPYGKIDSEGRWFNSRYRGKTIKRKGTYRGCADLTPALVKLIGHNQKEQVVLVLLTSAPTGCENTWRAGVRRASDDC